jgi:hypothetical protein
VQRGRRRRRRRRRSCGGQYPVAEPLPSLTPLLLPNNASTLETFLVHTTLKMFQYTNLQDPDAFPTTSNLSNKDHLSLSLSLSRSPCLFGCVCWFPSEILASCSHMSQK